MKEQRKDGGKEGRKYIKEGRKADEGREEQRKGGRKEDRRKEGRKIRKDRRPEYITDRR
jgi:hypothetical protein